MALHKAEEFGLEDRRMAISLSPPAQGHAGQGEYVEVEPVYLQTLKIYQTVHGKFHVHGAATLNNLGVLHRMYGRYAQAEALLTRALTIKEKPLGLPSRRGVECHESGPPARGPGSAGESGTAVPSSLGDSRAGAGAVPSRSRKDTGGTLPMPYGN